MPSTSGRMKMPPTASAAPRGPAARPAPRRRAPSAGASACRTRCRAGRPCSRAHHPAPVRLTHPPATPPCAVTAPTACGCCRGCSVSPAELEELGDTLVEALQELLVDLGRHGRAGDLAEAEALEERGLEREHEEALDAELARDLQDARDEARAEPVALRRRVDRDAADLCEVLPQDVQRSAPRWPRRARRRRTPARPRSTGRAPSRAGSARTQRARRAVSSPARPRCGRDG